MIYNLTVINPYGVGQFILLTFSESPHTKATWVLHDSNGVQVERGKGYSKHSKCHSLIRQAELNGEAWARRYMVKHYPLFCEKGK